jgi:hypothetical protein
MNRRAPCDVEVQIGEIVVEGVAPAEWPRAAAAMESELTRLVASRGAMMGPSAHSIDVVTAQVAPAASPETVGAEIARAIFLGMAGS